MRFLHANELIGGFTADPFLIVGCGIGAWLAASRPKLWPFGVLGGFFLLVDFVTDWP
jgi:hypothetical protein